MYEANVQVLPLAAPTILRCPRCSKPFDKQTTLKRHGYYCRSRRPTTTPRTRSCTACVTAKTRCDARRPECSRCLDKGVECRYPANATIDDAAHISNQPRKKRARKESTATSTLPAIDRQEIGRNFGIDDISLLPDNILDIPDASFTNLGATDSLPWDDALAADFNFTDFLLPQTYTSSPSSSLVHDSTPSSTASLDLSSSNVSISIPTPISPPESQSMLGLQRHKRNASAQRICNLVMHTLKSYPLMLLRDNALPPFIHPVLLSAEFENEKGRKNDMESLTNCISLVHMLRGGVRGCWKLFWKNVGMECRRICEDYVKMNKWEMLAGMQALFIYVTMRLDRRETDDGNVDYLILAAIRALCTRITCSDADCNASSELCHYGREIGWKDWIFEECRRRLAVVYRVVNMLVYFEAGTECDMHSDLLMAPLPAKKQLWEASDEFAWKKQTINDPERETAFAMVTNGDLVRIHGGPIHCSDSVLARKALDGKPISRSAADWEEWCAGMDGFGGLIMLAASLVV